ncbi:MAG: hypothetical protein KatS3mg076_2865 [Candidatus Binatia bacterium]|nr:MAG: hypothetical protein KatS3mg076_2865 [Candidatus Binatia bacterium]
MLAGRSIALATVRVPRGSTRPPEEAFWEALELDRARLGLPPSNGTGELVVAGPFPVFADGQELDEYVVWER